MPLIGGGNSLQVTDKLDCIATNKKLKDMILTSKECEERCSVVGQKKTATNTCSTTSSANRMNLIFGAIGAVVVMSGLLI
eukprot:8449081-Ditylum_brightwellii.AAC.1